jgi:hypothetical protein
METPKVEVDEFKSFLKLPGGGEIKRCYYPFKLDAYGKGKIRGFKNAYDFENSYFTAR